MLKNKPCFLFLFLLLISLFQVFSEEYILDSVNYDMQGRTTEYVLNINIPIIVGETFDSKDSFDIYIDTLYKELKNLRVLSYVEIKIEYLEMYQGKIPVVLTIKTIDSMNLLVLPYPKYDSNTGFMLKIKLKDYNFLGTMQELNFDVNYETLNGNNSVGSNMSFSYYFPINKIDSVFTTFYGVSYTFGESLPDLDINASLQFNIPFFSTQAEIALNQGFYIEPEYLQTNDQMYFAESVSLGVPIKLWQISNWSSLVLRPSASFTYLWNDNIIDNPSLNITNLAFGCTLSASSIDWNGNFRKGLSLSLSQGLNLIDKKDTLLPSYTGEIKYFIHNSFLALESRLYGFYSNESLGSTEFGCKMRGIPDSLYRNQIIVLNVAIPMYIVQTDWITWKFPSFFKYLDFEMQLSPFVDLGFSTDSEFLFTGGLEILGYLNRFRSIQGRISMGFDINKLIENNLVSWYEIYAGIGLFF